MFLKNKLHIVPINDLIIHNTSFENEFDNCKCNPEIEGLLVVHSAMDRREFFEQKTGAKND